jgi:uncharacterized phage protein gp47/JayE
LITRVTADLNARFAGTYNALRRRVLAVFARVLAGLAHGLYGYLDWIANQVLPDTQAEAQLLRFGAIYGVERTAAAYASGNITVSGTYLTVIPDGTLFQTEDGVEYETTAEATIDPASATVTVQAVVAGAAGNVDAGAAINLVSPISGVTAAAVVATGGLAGGVDEEAIEAYRQRVLDRCGTFITGANAAIYTVWAKQVPGVTRAWAYENTPLAGTVTVLFVCDDDESSIIPDAGMIADVEAYLDEHVDPVTGELVGRAVNATLNVAGPTAAPIAFTITPSPDTAAVRAAIQAELEDLLRREPEPGADILISHIREAISIAAGESDYTMSAPAADVTVADGSIATLGAITWPA